MADRTDGAKKPRWGVILGVVLGALGLLTIAGNLLMFAQQVFADGGIHWRDMPWSFRIWDIELRVVAIGVGLAFISSGLCFAQLRARTGVILLVSAAVVMIFNPAVNSALRHRFAGDRYTIRGPTKGEKDVTFAPGDGPKNPMPREQDGADSPQK
ncbi:MAG TPA: hypothetical protein VGN12_26880 [Pirellulales bacterium]|jgi:hypothetical protein